MATDASDEAGRMSRAFEGMLFALAASRQQQRQLVADAGHELRTPIASIRSNAEVLLRYGDLDADTQQRVARDLVGESDELVAAVDGLVELARLPDSDQKPREVCLAVRDHGPGIPLDQREAVFSRFYRTEEARGTPGSGLGLAIVSDIVKAHGGRVVVAGPPSPATGTVMRITLPTSPC